MTRRARLEARAERRRSWAGKARARSEGRFHAVALLADGIPLGQPILQGHHSEARARRDAERIRSGMDKGCEELALAKHHAGRAEGIERALERTIFSDDPDAIEALEAKIFKLETERDEIKRLNARCRSGDACAIEIVKQRHPMYALCGDDPRRGMPAHKLTNIGAEIRRAKARIAEIEARRVKLEQAQAAGGVVLEGDPWCSITFAEKPAPEILNALRQADFIYGGGRWNGRREHVPASVLELLTPCGT